MLVHFTQYYGFDSFISVEKNVEVLLGKDEYAEYIWVIEKNREVIRENI